MFTDEKRAKIELEFPIMLSAWVELLKATDSPPLQRMMDARDLQRKFLQHAATGWSLRNGLSIDPMDDSVYDFQTVNCIARILAEGVMVFHYIFLGPDSAEEQEFWHAVWRMQGLADRGEFFTWPSLDDPNKTMSQMNAQQQQIDNRLIDDLKQRLLKNAHFQTLEQKVQERALRGDWKTIPGPGINSGRLSWENVARNASVSERYAKHLYKFYSFSVHSTSVSAFMEKTLDSNLKRGMLDRVIGQLGVLSAISIGFLAEMFPDAAAATPMLKNRDTKKVLTEWQTLGGPNNLVTN